MRHAAVARSSQAVVAVGDAPGSVTPANTVIGQAARDCGSTW
jgi:hypothetical protein